MDPISISAVSLIIGGGIGAILGRLTSGATEWQRKFITMKLRFTNAAEDAFLLGRQYKKLDAALGVYEAAEAKRQAQRKAAAIKAGERSHRDRLAREAEAAAKQSALHETMRSERADVRELIA